MHYKKSNISPLKATKISNMDDKNSVTIKHRQNMENNKNNIASSVIVNNIQNNGGKMTNSKNITNDAKKDKNIEKKGDHKDKKRETMINSSNMEKNMDKKSINIENKNDIMIREKSRKKDNTKDSWEIVDRIEKNSGNMDNSENMIKGANIENNSKNMENTITKYI